MKGIFLTFHETCVTPEVLTALLKIGQDRTCPRGESEVRDTEKLPDLSNEKKISQRVRLHCPTFG